MSRENSIGDAVREEWSRMGWRWFATFSFPAVNGLEGAERWKREFFRLLHAGARQGIAARGWWFREPHCHAHLLLSARDTARPLFPDAIGEGVTGGAYRALQAAWKRRTRGGSVDIRSVYEPGKLAGYISGQRNVGRVGQRYEYLAPVNGRLLKRMGL